MIKFKTNAMNRYFILASNVALGKSRVKTMGTKRLESGGATALSNLKNAGYQLIKVNIGNYKNLKHKFLWKMERNQYVFLLFSLSVLFQYIEIFQFSRIDADTMDIKYEMINVISFRDFLDTLFTCMLYVHDDVIT